MNKEQFTKKLMEVIRLRLDESYSVKKHYVTKNNDVQLLAIIIQGEGQTVCPTIYIDDYYEDFCNGMDILVIAKKVIDTYHRHSQKVEYDYVGNLKNMQDRIMCKLVNRKSNTYILANAPHKDFLDLSILYYIDYDIGEDGFHQILTISNHIMEYIGLTPGQLDELATANMARLSKPHIESIMSVMLKASGFDEEFDTHNYCDTVDNMYIFSNETKFHGATCILQEGILRNFADQKEADKIWIIPSSIHEMILILDNGTVCAEDINMMIQEVNEAFVNPQDVLSAHSYIYDRQTDSISVA